MKNARFEKLVDIILHNEGGYVNHHSDPGGETNFGISKRAYPHEDIKGMTRDRAKQIYFADYYSKVKADSFIDEMLALSIFDFAVNAGVRMASILLQRTIGVEDDGIIGNVTIAKANSTSEVGDKYNEARISYYKSLPTFKTFGKGWTNRVKYISNAI